MATIKDIPTKLLIEPIGELILDSIDLLNANVSDDVAVKLTRATIDLLKDRYIGLSLLEVEKAFNRGQAGEFGEFYGMNIQTIGKWLKGYNEKVRQPEMKKFYGSSASQVEQELSPQEKEKKIYTEILEDLKVKFNDYKNGSYNFNNIQLNISFYNTLDYFGFITITSDQKNQVLESFIQKVKEKHKALGERGAIFKEFMIQSLPGNPFYNEAIFYCKEYVFKEYVKSRKSQNLELF